MKPGAKAIAWICMASTIFAACSSSMLIDPQGNEKDKLYSDPVEYVVMKDSTQVVFDSPPTIGKALIVGQVKGQKKSIPLSEVTQVSVSHSYAPLIVTMVVVGGAAAAMLIGVRVMSSSSLKGIHS